MEYLSPGVYVEERDVGPKPIEGVSTSTTGAIGVTVRGPTRGKPELVTSFAEFERKFGGLMQEPQNPALVNQWSFNPAEGGRWWQFPLAVKGFFDNGGKRLFVKRVFSSTAVASSAILGQGVTAELEEDTDATDTEIQVRHLIGIQQGSTINIFASGNPLPNNPFTVQSYDVTTRTLQLDQALGQTLRAGRDFIEINARQAPAAGPPDTRTLEFRAIAHGNWGNRLRVRMGPMVGAALNILAHPVLGGAPANTRISATQEVNLTVAANAGDVTLTVDNLGPLQNNDVVVINGAQYTISNVTAGPPDSVDINPAVPAGNTWGVGTTITPLIRTIEVDDVAGFSNTNRVRINGREYTINNVTAGPPASMDVSPTPPPGTVWAQGTAVQLLRLANDTAAPAVTINVQGASRLYRNAMVELDNGTNKENFTVNSVLGDTVTLSGNITQQYLEGHKLRLIEAEVGVRLLAEGGDEIEEEETYSYLRLVDEPPGTLSFLPRHIETRSEQVDVIPHAGLSTNNSALFPVTVAQNGMSWQELGNGADNLDGLTVDDFVGVDGGSGNRTGIQALEDIEEISMCLAPGMWSSTVQSALIRHCEQLRYRFAIIDPQDDLSLNEIRSVREPIDTKYAAIYYPWLRVRDPSVRRNVTIAPSAHIAGLYARVDNERGVHKAPANEVIRGIVLPNPATGVGGIAQDITQREQDVLNPVGINALRYFPGRGQRVWGARTLSSDASWKYINLRRVFIFVEHSIDRGTQWVVFEPNDEPLWARVRQTITNFLTTVWRSGALQGPTAEDAFFVRCDRTTMTQDDIDNGRLICVIGIAVVKPAEFVIFRIQQKTFTEEAG